MENYNTGYSTYVIGNSSNISNSLEVILYNKNDKTQVVEYNDDLLDTLEEGWEIR